MVLSDIFLIASIACLLFIGWRDFVTLKISNQIVIVLLVLYLGFTATRGFDGIVDDLLAGGLLFGLTFIFWLLGKIGAGDVKLYLPVGLFIGLNGLLPYAVFLAATSILVLLVIKVGGRFAKGTTYFGKRLQELRGLGKVPYGVPMGLSAVGVMIGERLIAT
ncbi:MAG: prepilin peptidase [Pseudomonadota bacterium]